MNKEWLLAHNYINKINAEESIAEQEIAYWNYEWYISKKEHSTKLKGLIQKIHKEQMDELLK